MWYSFTSGTQVKMRHVTKEEAPASILPLGSRPFQENVSFGRSDHFGIDVQFKKHSCNQLSVSSEPRLRSPAASRERVSSACYFLTQGAHTTQPRPALLTGCSDGNGCRLGGYLPGLLSTFLQTRLVISYTFSFGSLRLTQRLLESPSLLHTLSLLA